VIELGKIGLADIGACPGIGNAPRQVAGGSGFNAGNLFGLFRPVIFQLLPGAFEYGRHPQRSDMCLGGVFTLKGRADALQRQAAFWRFDYSLLCLVVDIKYILIAAALHVALAQEIPVIQPHQQGHVSLLGDKFSLVNFLLDNDLRH